VLPADLIWTTNDRAICWRRGWTHLKARARQHRRGQNQCYSTIHSLSPRLDVPLWQKHPTSYPSSWRFGASSHSENRWTTQTTQPIGRSFYHCQSHWARIIWVDDRIRHTS
jgi:hypothetical protein